MRKSRSRILRPISLRLLTGLILVSITVAYYLLPTHRKLLERQLEDGKTQKALFTLRGMPASEREKDSAYYTLLELRLVRELLDPSDTQAVIRQILEASHGYEQFDFQDPFLKELLPLIMFTRDIERIHKFLRPVLTRMPSEGRQQIYLYLANAALAADKPTLAPTLYVKFWEDSPPTTETTIQMSRLWRSSGNARRALETIESLIQQKGTNAAELSYEIAKLRIDLLRETGEAGKAFDAIRILIPLANEDRAAELFDQMIKTSLESSRSIEALPDVKARAEASPEDAKLWKLLGDLSVSAGDLKLGIYAFDKLAQLEHETSEHLMKVGQLCEWTDQPGRAFDSYLQALKINDPSGIERLAALSQGLYRDAELALALEDLGDLVDPQNYALQFARLYGRVGDFEKAKQLYTELLELPDASIDLLIEYGTFLHALSEFTPAYEAFTKAAKLRPDDLQILSSLAEIQFRLANYDQSLKDYEALLRVSNEPDVFEKYINLAESLGDLDGIVTGLRTKITRKVNVSPYDFERLAVFLNIQGKNSAYFETLEEVLVHYPEEKNLRETAAYAYSDAGEYPDAVRLLEKHPDLKTNSRLVRFYLGVLVALKEFEKAQTFLASGLDETLLDLSAVLEVRAYVYEASGNVPESVRIYGRLHEKDPRSARYALNYGRLLSGLGRTKEAQALIGPFLENATPEVLRLAAQVYSAVGDYKSAEKYQRRFLDSPPQPYEQPQAWGFLGDLLSVRGDKRSAKKAYSEGVHAIFRTLASAKE